MNKRVYIIIPLNYWIRNCPGCYGKEKGMPMENRIDRNQISFATPEEHNKKEKDYWANASYEEKLQIITYLRECFYGPDASTGRLQGFYTFLKRK